MTTFFVTRHSAVIDWAEQEGFLSNAHIVSQLDIDHVQAGDVVIGALPIQMAVQVCERGAQYRHIHLDTRSRLEGREITVAALRARNIRLENLSIQHAPAAPEETQRTVHVCLVSEESLHNLLPACLPGMRADRCILLVDADMQHLGAEQRLRFALEHAGCHNIEIIDGLPQHNIAEIISWSQRLAQRLFAVEPLPRYILNLTCGSKLTTLGMLQAFMPRCEVIYCDTARNLVEFLRPPRPPLPLDVELTHLDTLLATYGLRATPSSLTHSGIEERRALSLWLASHVDQLGDLMRRLNLAASRFGDRRLPRPAFPRPHESGAIDRMLLAGVLAHHGDTVEVTENGNDYLQGGWLREYCWLVVNILTASELIDRKQLLFDATLTPVIAPPGRTAGKSHVDCLLAYRNRLLVVQCHTGPLRDESEFMQHVLEPFEPFNRDRAPRYLTRLLLTTVSNIPLPMHDTLARAGVTVLSATVLDKLGDWLLRWLKAA